MSKTIIRPNYMNVVHNDQYGFHPSNYDLIFRDEQGNEYVIEIAGQSTSNIDGQTTDMGEALAEAVVAALGYEIDRTLA